MIIYKVTNNINGKIYIGQTIKTLQKRWLQHGHKSKNSHFAQAIRKYGKENFTIEQIDSAEDREELNEMEIYWIKFFNSNDREIGYNMDLGGKSSERSEEVREKIRQGNLGVKKPQTPEVIERRRLAQIGRKTKPHTEETKQKMREKALNRKHTPETKEKLRQYRTGKKNSPEHIEKSRLAHVGRKQSEETIRKRVEAMIKTKKLKSLTKE